MRSPGKPRKSRAGQHAHKSGNYVRSAPKHIVRPSHEPPELDREAATYSTRKPVTLPKVGWLDRKDPE